MFKYLPVTLVFGMTLASAQPTLEEWARIHGQSAQDHTAPEAVQVVRGGLTTFQDRASFNAAFPVAGQTCEDFEGGSLNDGDIVGFPAPLNSTTDNAVFSAGSIIPGLSIEDNPLNDANSGSPNGLVGIGATFSGTPSDLVAANTFVDTLVANLSPAVENIAFDVFSFSAGGTATVTFFDATDSQIGQLSVGATPTVGGFVGVSSPLPIARIEVFSQDGTGADEAEAIDDVCLAGEPVPQLESVPANGPLGLGVLVLLMFATMIVVTRRVY